MDNVGARRARRRRNPVKHMAVLSWLQMRCNETYSVNESCLGQQGQCATCIAANAIRSSRGVKLIRRIYGVLDLLFHVSEELHTAACELKIPSEVVPHVTKKRHACL